MALRAQEDARVLPGVLLSTLAIVGAGEFTGIWGHALRGAIATARPRVHDPSLTLADQADHLAAELVHSLYGDRSYFVEAKEALMEALNSCTSP